MVQCPHIALTCELPDTTGTGRVCEGEILQTLIGNLVLTSLLLLLMPSGDLILEGIREVIASSDY